MAEKDTILQELKELNSHLATASLQEVYTVPAGYFEGLAAQVLNRIKAIEANTPAEELGYLSPVLSSIPKEMPFSVPQGYFDGLAEKAVQFVTGTSEPLSTKEELAALSPLLSSLKKEMPYSVPQGYFESLSATIVAAETKAAPKVISMASRNWFRFAAAAVITGIIVMAGLLFTGGGEKEPGGKALAKFTRDIKKMNEIQKDNLIDFIDAGITGNETAQVNTDSKTDEVKNLLEGISDEELKKFQEQTEDVQDVLMPN